MDFGTTPSQTVGPYFRIGLVDKYSKPGIARPQAKGERVALAILVLDGDGAPVNDALIEIWQADASGKYNHPDDLQPQVSDPACDGFGRMGTDEDGRCRFETIKPGRVPGAGNASQGPHLNVAVFARGMLKQFYTRIYFSGDPANQQDQVLALVPPERRETLMAQPHPAQPGLWRFEIRLQGEGETVFFEV
jgi:protocatechuate 3,4-dioxygenase, alpha subunit